MSSRSWWSCPEGGKKTKVTNATLFDRKWPTGYNSWRQRQGWRWKSFKERFLFFCFLNSSCCLLRGPPPPPQKKGCAAEGESAQERLNNPVWESTGPAPPSPLLPGIFLPCQKSSRPDVVVYEYESKTTTPRRLLLLPLPRGVLGLARRDMHGGGNTRADPVHCASGSGSGAPIQVGYREPGLNEPPWVSLSCLPGSSFRLFLFFSSLFFYSLDEVGSRLRHGTWEASHSGSRLPLPPQRVCFSLSVSRMCPSVQFHWASSKL